MNIEKAEKCAAIAKSLFSSEAPSSVDSRERVFYLLYGGSEVTNTSITLFEQRRDHVRDVQHCLALAERLVPSVEGELIDRAQYRCKIFEEELALLTKRASAHRMPDSIAALTAAFDQKAAPALQQQAYNGVTQASDRKQHRDRRPSFWRRLLARFSRSYERL